MNNGLRCDCEAEAEASKYLRAMKLSEACRTDTDLQQGVVYEDVLVLCLHHIVPLCSKTRDVAIHVHSFLVFHPHLYFVNLECIFLCNFSETLKLFKGNVMEINNFHLREI